MSRYGTPTKDEVTRVASEAISIFAKHKYSCCLVGGLACMLFGNSRTPNDVDLVVLDSPYGQETLKRILVDHPGSRFYLVDAKTPGATYKVLWYRLDEYLISSYSRNRRSCKVDILIPGIMNIPDVPLNKVVLLKGLPAMPLIGLIMLKLQAWEDHRNHNKNYMQVKQFTDVSDLEALLPIAIRDGRSVDTESWIPASFVTAARERVLRFLASYPAQSQNWRRIGFSVPSSTIRTRRPVSDRHLVDMFERFNLR